MARYTASARRAAGRPILLRHQLAYGGGNLLGSGALRGGARRFFFFIFLSLWALSLILAFSFSSPRVLGPVIGAAGVMGRKWVRENAAG